MRRAAAVLVVFAGCVSTGAMQRASTLGKGRWEVGFEAGAHVFADTFTPRPAAADVAARWGVHERIDVGFRAGLSALEGQAKFMLTAPASPVFVVSLAPTLGLQSFGVVAGGFGASGVALFPAVTLPLMVGMRLGPHELVLAPRSMLGLPFGSGRFPLVWAGASLGVALRLTPRLTLMPELGVLYPVTRFGTVSGASLVFGVPGDVATVQLRLGLLLNNAP